MYKDHFNKAAETVGLLNKKGDGLWGSLALAVHEWRVGLVDNPACPDPTEEACKEMFKEEEKRLNREKLVAMDKNSTYRVCKSVLIGAVKHNIPLVDADGKPRGKTDVEAAVKEEKAGKSPADKFKAAMSAATKAVDAMEKQEELETAYLLAKELTDYLVAVMPKSMKA